SWAQRSRGSAEHRRAPPVPVPAPALEPAPVPMRRRRRAEPEGPAVAAGAGRPAQARPRRSGPTRRHRSSRSLASGHVASQDLRVAPAVTTILTGGTNAVTGASGPIPRSRERVQGARSWPRLYWVI